MKITVAYCHPPMVSHRFMSSMIRLLGSSNDLTRMSKLSGGPAVPRARNALVGAFLNGSDDALLMVDADTVFTPGDLADLISADVAIAGALVHGRHETSAAIFPAAVVRDGDHYRRLRSEEISPDPIRVAGVGMAFTLIRRAVLWSVCSLHKVSDDWPFAAERHGGQVVSEDINFCLRARSAGFETWLVPTAQVGHIRETVL